MDSNMSVLLHLDVEPLRRCAWCKGPFTPSVRFNKSNFHFLENRWFACWPMWVCVQVGRSFPLRKLFMGYAWNWINFAFRNCPFFIPEPRDTFRDVVNSLATSNDSQKKQKTPRVNRKPPKDKVCTKFFLNSEYCRLDLLFYFSF